MTNGNYRKNIINISLKAPVSFELTNDFDERSNYIHADFLKKSQPSFVYKNNINNKIIKGPIVLGIEQIYHNNKIANYKIKLDDNTELFIAPDNVISYLVKKVYKN